MLISTPHIPVYVKKVFFPERITHEDGGDRLGETDRWDYEN